MKSPGHTGKTILLVEDEALIALMEKKLLTRNGFSVITAYNSRDAIDTVHKNSVDLVLMDIDLGIDDADGTQTAAEILKNHKLPIIFLTSHTEKEMVNKVKKITNYGYVVKNSGEFVLVESINMAFSLFEANRNSERKEEELQEVLNNIDLAILRFDRNGKITFFSEGAERIFGFDSSEVLGRTSVETINPPVDRLGTDQRKMMEAIFRDPQKYHHNENENVCKDGTRLWMSWKNTAIYNDNGEMLYIQAIGENITKQKEIEDLFFQSEEKYAKIFEASPSMIGLSDIETGEYLQVNQVFYETLGYTPEEVIGKRSTEFLGLDENFRKNFIEQLRQDGFVKNQEAVVYSKLGTPVHVLLSATFIDVQDGKYIFTTATDITPRKMAEEALRSKAEEQELLLETMDAQVWYLTDTETYGLANKAHAEFLGLSKADIEYRKLSEFLPDSVASICKQGNCTVFDSRKAIKTEEWIQNAAGDNRLISITKTPQVNRAGIVEFVVCVGTDITEFIEREDELKKLNLQKDFLMQELNHRVKNNLAMINSLLVLKEANAGGSTDFADIRSQIEAIRIVHEKLHETGDITQVNIRDYILDFLSTIFSSFSHVAVKINSAIEDVHMGTKNAISLGLLINEIASNAIKHGFVNIQHAVFSIELIRDVSENIYILSLSNNGAPFPEDIMIDNPRTLGSQIVSELVRQLSGTIELTRSPHPEFTIQFPVEKNLC